MIILFLMSYSLLLRSTSTNDPPRHPRCLWTDPTQGWRISNLSVDDAALGEVLVSQVFNKPYWGQWDEAGSPDSSPQPPPDTLPAPSLHEDPPPCPSHHLPSSSLILPSLHTHVQQISVAFPHPFSVHTPSSSTSLKAPVCAPACQPSWGHQLYSEEFVSKSSSGRHYKDHHQAWWLMLP